MRKSFILSGIIGLSVIIGSGFTVVNSSGIAYYTNSPSDGATCNACHSGGTATTTGSVTATPAFGGSGTNLTYVPNTTYTITVKESGYPDWGFDVEILNCNTSSCVTNAGTMTAISTNCKLNGTGPTNITHKATIATATTATFKWVAPASGTAYLYAAINGVNGNGSTSGDKVMNIAYVLTPAAASPVAAFTESSNTICAGQSITLTDNSTNTPTSWAWTMTGGTPASSTSQNPSVSYASAGTYTVSLVATNAGGSSSPVSHVVTVNALPSVVATSTTICDGSSASLTASGATTYAWNTGGTSATLNVSPTTTTTYSVTGTTSGCSKTATAVVTVNPLPVVTAPSQTVCSTATTATLSASGATTYSWSTGGTNPTCIVTPPSTTTYSVWGTTSGCRSTAVPVTVTVKPCTSGIENYNIANQINIFPNPASDYLNINLGLLSGSKTAELYDVSGRLIMDKNTEGDAMQLNIADVAKGTYFVKIMNDKTVVAVKMIIISK